MEETIENAQNKAENAPATGNQLATYEFAGHQVRVYGTPEAPQFRGSDVCDCLGVENVSDALSRLDEDEIDSIDIIDAIGRRQEIRTVTEAGLYALVLGSRKPEAKAFKRWITHEVLPSIRKTGRYEDSGGRLHSDSAPQPTRAEVDLRKLACACVGDLAKFLLEHGGPTNQAGVQALLVRRAEIATSENLATYLPKLDGGPWLSPSQVAEQIGVTVQRIGRTITALGLRGNAEYSKEILNTKAHSEGNVVSYLYNSAGVEAIKVALSGSTESTVSPPGSVAP